MKKVKALKNAHTSNSKKGMGDNYGPGVKQKIGREIDSYGTDKMTNKKIGKPPKSLA
jgi:hypothetical protein